MSHEFPDKPVVGVGAAIFRDGQVLLVKRGRPPAEGTWTLPGGKQQLGETVAEAARREVLEETGLTIEVRDVAAVVDLIHRAEAGDIHYHYTVIDVAALWLSGDAVAGDDAAAVAWVWPDRLDEYEVTPQTARVVQQAMRKLTES